MGDSGKKLLPHGFSRVFKKLLVDAAAKPREPPKESKLRAFMKRGSEPLLGMQLAQQVFSMKLLRVHNILQFPMHLKLGNDLIIK